MGFTENELKFIDENKQLIDQGRDGLKKLLEKVNEASYSYLGRISSGRLRFLLVFNCLGVEGFAFSGKVQPLSVVIQGCLANQTTAKAKGEPLVPALFKSNTKVILYKITNNSIESSKKYSLVDRPSLNKEMVEGGYNLCILDKTQYKETVEKAFGKIKNYGFMIGISELYNIGYTGLNFYSMVESESPAEARLKGFEDLTGKLTELLTDDFSKVVSAIIEEADKRVNF